MKTFAEYLPTMTARERKIVESFHAAHAEMEAWHNEDDPKTDWPIEQMRATTPAKEPESLCAVVGKAYGELIFQMASKFMFQPGDRVRVVKIEEPQP